MSKAAKIGAILHVEAFRTKDPSTETSGFTNIGDTPAEMAQFEP